MDAYEATRIVFSRIQNLDPENASKIMGLLLIQDHGEKEMIRLAFGPEALVHSVVLKARKDLGISSNTCSTPSTPSPSPFFTNSLSRQTSSSFSSSRLLSNLSPSSSSWAPSSFSDVHNLDGLISPNSSSTTTTSASYAAVVAAAMNGFNTNNMVVGVGSTSSPSSATATDLLIDEFQLQDQLSFLNDAAAGPKSPDLFYPPTPESGSDAMLFPPYWGASNNGNHRRSCSVTDMCMGSDPMGSGLGWKPCLYFARGYCKNGTSCRFLHGLPDSPESIVGSPNKLDVMEQCQELLLRSKTQQQQQQQLRSQLMPSPTFPYSPTTTAAGKSINFYLQQQQQSDAQRAAAAALMLSEDLHKFSRNRIERNDYSNSLGGGMVMNNPGSRQIYLTFPADSTFREEDVSNYFSIYGPVQDVRIPYQQKRMFGFVTFVYPETVKLILAKGNPHFVCDARVLVKPYKEKGKVPDKYRKQQQQQQIERGDFSVCTTPTGLDSRDPYDLQLGARMFNSTQDVLLRKKLEEQVELQQAMELQSRRFLGLQLLDVKKHHHHQRNLSAGTIAAPIPSPTHPYSSHFTHTLIHPSSSSDRSSPESNEENCMNLAITVAPAVDATVVDKQALKLNVEKEEFNDDGNGKEIPKHDECDFHNSLEHNLPDSPFASPTKSGDDAPSFFSTTVAEADRSFAASASSSSSSINNNSLMASSLLPATSTLDMASFNSCFFQIPRFSSDHGAIGM